MNDKLEQLRAEIERQDAELDQVMKQLAELADAGVALSVPEEFFAELDTTCEVRRTTSPNHVNALRA